VAPAAPSFLVISNRLPPDRNTGADPTGEFASDQAPITGSYFLQFTAPAGVVFHGPLTAGTGNAYLYKSNGVLAGSPLTAAELIIDNNTVAFPFATRDLKTDYYILLDEGLLKYNVCSGQTVSLSPAITAATGSGAWNFNTPAYTTTAYTLAGSAFTAPNGTVPTLSSHTPGGVDQCINAEVSLAFSVAIVKGSGNVRIKKFSDDSLIQTINVSTGTVVGNVITFATLSGAYVGATQYYIEVDAGAVLSNNGDCYQQTANAVINKASNKVFTLLPTFAFSSFVVTSLPVTSDPTRQKVNPQTTIGIVFNRAITLHSSGTITLNSSAGTHQVFNVADTFASAQVSELISVSGSTLTINPTLDLALNTDYHVLLSAGCVVDSCNTVFGGLSNAATIAFKTDAGPVSTVGAFSASGSVNETGVVMDFDRTVQPSTGLLRIKDATTGVDIMTVSASNPAVTITEI
jgi:hypothetical protein